MKKIIFAAGLLAFALASSAYAAAPKLKGTYLMSASVVCQDSLSSGAPAIGGDLRQMVGIVSIGTSSGPSTKWTIQGDNAEGTLFASAADFKLHSMKFSPAMTITGSSNPYTVKGDSGETGYIYLTDVSSGIAAKAYAAFHGEGGKCLTTITVEK